MVWSPSLAELEAIRRASVPIIRETPLYSSASLSSVCGGEVAIKAECLQRTGSFKLRGTLSKLRDRDAGNCRGVVSGSAGNHAQALAYAARVRGIACTVFMPRGAALSKLSAVEAFGAEVRLHDGSVDDCIEAARELAAADGLLFVHPFDDVEIVEGQAGVGLDLLEQAPDMAQVVVPVGGGGLISGIAAAIRSAGRPIRIVAVQAAGCAPFPASLAAGEPVPVAAGATIADGIAVKRPGDLTLGLIERWVDEVVTVEDEAIAEAMVLLVNRCKLVAEGAGAASVAALLAGAVAPAPSGTTVAVLSGGNVDARVLARVINRQETQVGRRARLFARVPDQPGGLADLLAAVAGTGANVLDVTHLRDGVELGVEQTGIELIVETRGNEHAATLLQRLAEAGYQVELTP
ncbi:MAG TPA: threonine ammonia-lyase [Solirubrobacterales bacterium]|nr:threonine ammonia-lyase [Solirubrobacterales bacterium]